MSIKITVLCIEHFAKKHEYDFYYNVRYDGVYCLFYNSPSYKSFETTVPYNKPLIHLKKAFEMR